MNYAFQIAGQLRKFKTSHQFYQQQIFNNIDLDIFLSTWTTNSHSKIVDEGTIEDYTDLYKPVVIDIDNYDVIQTDQIQYIKKLVLANKKIVTYISPLITILQAYKRWKCNMLRKSYIKKYDVVIVGRPDLILGEPLFEHHLIEAQDKLIIPMGGDWEGGICDLLAIGPPKYIDIYCDLFTHLEQYIKNNVMFHPEHMLKYHLYQYKIPISRVSYVIHLNQKRMT